MTGPRYSPVQLARLLGAAEPTAEQAAVIGAPLGPMAVIAGAGSGKSETMANRLVWLVANRLVRPERVLGLTFTRKAAAELGDRVRARLDGLHRAGLAVSGDDELPGEPTVSTYHAYAGRLVTDHALRDGLEPSLRLVTPAVSWQIAARVVAAYDGPMDAVNWAPATVTAAVIDLAGELAEHLRTAEDVLGPGRWLDQCLAGLPGRVPALTRKVIASQRTREQLLPLVAAFHRAKTAREVIDYGDQMAIAARIAARHPEVGAAERGRYQVVLLDEYQDTSHAQLVLLRALFSGGHPVTAVGDPCQSIYGWRGASAGNLRRFRADFPETEAQPAPVLALSTSFRNTGRVLAAAGAIQAELRASAPDVPLLAAPPGRAERGQVVCALLDSALEEADWVAEQVAGLLKLEPGLAPDGRPWPDGRPDPVRPSDVAVLCRKRAQFPALRAALEARGIPVEVVGLGGLLTVPEVADIVATLRVLHDPTAADALARLLTSPRWRIGPADLVALGRRARALAREVAGPGAGQDRAGQGGPGQARPDGRAGDRPASEPGQRTDDLMDRAVTDLTRDAGSLVEALDDLDGPAAYSRPATRGLSALAAELRALRAPRGPAAARPGHRSRADARARHRGRLPARCRSRRRAGRPGRLHRRRGRLRRRAGGATLGAFLAYLSAAEEEEFGLEGGRVGETDSVKLATVHAAKGLQWPAVFVPGLSGGSQSQVFPARPRVTTRWTENPRLLPFSLRGDAADLPALAGLAASDLSMFGEACAGRELAEERRLAYVAATRAAFWLACTGYWWGEGVSRLGPSAFLDEVRGVCQAGEGVVAVWAAEPEPDAANPALAEPATAPWPAAAGVPPARAAVRAAAELVDQAIAELDAPSPGAPRRRARRRCRATAGRRPAPGAARRLGPRDRAAAGRARPPPRPAATPRSRCPASSPSPPWSPWPGTRPSWPARCAAPCRARPPRTPCAAPTSTAGSRSGSASRSSSTPTSCPAPPTTWTGPGPMPGWPGSRSGSRPASGPAGSPPRSRCRSRPWSATGSSGAASTRCSPTAVTARSTSWTGRPAGRRPPTPSGRRPRCSSPPTGWPGPGWPGCPWRSVRAAFYYVAADLTVRPADLLDEAGLAGLLAAVPAAEDSATHPAPQPAPRPA